MGAAKYLSITVIYIKFLLAYIYLHTIKRRVLTSEIWLIGEKNTEARDNAYHFYKYMCSSHSEKKFYYVIKRGSADEYKIDKHRLIYYNSFKHFYYYLAATIRIGSQIHCGQPYNQYSSLNKYMRRLVNKKQKCVFIGHGIKKDRIATADYRISGYSLMTLGAKAEYEYYKNLYKIPDEKIELTGFCRFDELQRRLMEPTIDQILIMPTFREWLRTSNSSKKEATTEEKSRFKESLFFKTYVSLLNDQSMANELKKRNMKLIFYLHYTMQPYVRVFENAVNNENIIIANRDKYDVQQLILQSKILITDYSSVFFDFGYLNKPCIYFQFDYSQYRSLHYKEGYFSYENNGFGPVFKNKEHVIQYMKELLDNNCKANDLYLMRMKSFFIPYDGVNCQRLFDAIRNRHWCA